MMIQNHTSPAVGRAQYVEVHASVPRQSLDEDGNNPNLPVFSYYESHVSNTITHVYISQNITEPAIYIPLIQMLNTRCSGDVVHIHFNCYGGRIDAGIQILTAILNTAANVVGHLDGVAYSMAAVLFLACEAHYVSPYGKLMLHTYSGGGGGGKAPDQRAAQAAIDDTYERIVRDICVPFLTKREVKDMLENSRDLYFGYDQIVDRLQQRNQPKKPKRSKAMQQDVAPELQVEVEAVEEVTSLTVDDVSTEE